MVILKVIGKLIKTLVMGNKSINTLTGFTWTKKISEVALFFAFFLGILFILSCKKALDPLPEISIMNASQVRSTDASTMSFIVKISKPIEIIATANYSMKDGTAVSPGDFISASGTVSIPPNHSQATIDVQIKGDPMNNRQPNLQFSVELSKPKTCTIATASATGTIITEDGANLSTDNTGYTTPLTYPGYTLAWSDEFSGTGLDLNVWNQETGNGSNGWGNNELEYYTNNPKNTFVSNGNLIIEARRETLNNFNYTSGRMTTQNKKFFTFGRIDIRAKLPVGKGIWPALWMLGTNIPTAGWPACGEIDIMELIGTYPARVTGTMHWKAANGSHGSTGADYTLSSGDFSQQFHVYSIIWANNEIKWYIDDQLFVSASATDVGTADYPFNADQFFIFNVAVGGNWPGSPDNTTTFPQRMFVDYVRVFQ
jgi:beta-glucanase (GH16 family)